MPKTPRAADRPEGDRIAKLLARAGVASRREIERMIDNSYSLVVRGLPARERQALEIRYGRSKLYL